MTDPLAEIARAAAACRMCVQTPLGKPLPHAPRPVFQVSSSARLLIVGQAPGTRVHQSGKPFTDPSGDRLRAWLGIGTEVFYDAERVAILPMGFCFPGLDEKGGDRPPRRECAPLWRARFLAAMPQIELIVALGRHAHGYHLPQTRTVSLTQTVENWRATLAAESPPVMPLPHPSWRNNAWIKNNPWFERELVPELRRRVAPLISPRAGG